MKILYVAPFVPWEIKVRSFNLIPRLSRRHEIYLVCVSGPEPNSERKEWLNRYCKKWVYVPHRNWKAAVQCALALPTRKPLRLAYAQSIASQDAVRQIYQQAHPDVLYVERWRALEFIPPDVNLPMVCDPTDSMTLYNQRLMKAGAWWERIFAWEEYRKFSRCEGSLARRANVVVFCSRFDRDCVYQQAPEVRYELVPNGVDCRKYSFKDVAEEGEGQIIFTGRLEYRPNLHAVEYFLREIFPGVRQSVPNAKFLVVGKGANAALSKYLNITGFEVLDFVPDLRPYIAKAAVAVAPLTVGAGVSNKLGEGFAVGTPVVATPLACGDLPVTSGNELFIGCNADEFANQVILLLRSSALRREMALRARHFVEGYDWEVVSASMENLLEQVAAKNDETPKHFFAAAD